MLWNSNQDKHENALSLSWKLGRTYSVFIPDKSKGWEVELLCRFGKGKYSMYRKRMTVLYPSNLDVIMISGTCILDPSLYSLLATYQTSTQDPISDKYRGGGGVLTPGSPSGSALAQLLICCDISVTIGAPILPQKAWGPLSRNNRERMASCRWLEGHVIVKGLN